MTAEELKSLRGSRLFPGGAEVLVRKIGIEAAASLITAWPGQDFPVPVRIGGGNASGKRRWGALVGIVGEYAARQIVAYCGGSILYIPSCKEAIWAQVQNKIRADYDRLTGPEMGYTHPEAIFELGINYKVSGRAIEKSLARVD